MRTKKGMFTWVLEKMTYRTGDIQGKEKEEENNTNESNSGHVRDEIPT